MTGSRIQSYDYRNLTKVKVLYQTVLHTSVYDHIIRFSSYMIYNLASMLNVLDTVRMFGFPAMI